MSNYKISKTHRNILERAVAPYSEQIQLKFIGDDYVSIRCKITDTILANAYIQKDGDCSTSTEGLASIIGRLIYWSSNYIQVLDREYGKEQQG